MRFAEPMIVLTLLTACGGGKSQGGLIIDDDFAMTTMTPADLSHAPDAAIAAGGNVASLLVDSGVVQGVIDVAYVSVTLCAPGTSNCQTIDHVAIDTGSVGLRIVSSVLNSSLVSALPPLTTTSGDSIAECYTYADGYTYGSVRTADFTLAGEQVPSMAFHVIGDLTNAPTDCTSSGRSENDVDSFGYNGIIGIAPFTADCGTACASGEGGNPNYYDCAAGGTCTPTAVSVAAQVQNPISLFGTDSNGYNITLPSVDDVTGGTNLMGSLTFGISTRSNNAIGSQQVYAASSTEGLATVTGTVQSQSFPDTIFDSGTAGLAVSLGLTTCPDSSSYLCPSSTQTFPTTITDANGATGSTSFKIANADTLYSTSPNATAFDDIGTGGVDGLLILGLPFFYGKTIYIGMTGATSAGVVGPYYAF